ncbi:ADP-ribosylation factor-like protein 16 [Orchesella cincta]|uniref:ADP-ribosylation factor-like protein 16 n=1 Tax=Orchesella cincta TaxID=48709 RepID=A0A1D2MGU8_ORCCI|nr:ADP-ribosylation factor-like protein 16 [Orchesella cincta]
MACLCIGPISSGKTMLLKRLQGIEVDESTSTVETVGSNIVQIAKVSSVGNDGESKKSGSMSAKEEEKNFVGIREVGGSMSPLWPSYYSPYKPIVYVIDSSNLFQVSISTVHLMEILSHEKLIRCRVLIVLAKNDLTDTKKLNLLKFMMRLDNIINQAGKRVTLLESSSITGDGVEEIRKWIVENTAFSARLNQIEKGMVKI